jgi:hypothetical protein
VNDSGGVRRVQRGGNLDGDVERFRNGKILNRAAQSFAFEVL